jgi:hypothetical protein
MLVQKFQLREMAHAKIVNFHILSPILFPTDFGPGVQKEKRTIFTGNNPRYPRINSRYESRIPKHSCSK